MMELTAITNAVAAFRKAQKAAESMKNADLTTTIAEGLNALADARIEVANLKEQNRALREELAALKAGDPCPRCRKPGWGVTDSKPAGGLGALGVFQRTYQCPHCGLQESKMITD